MESTNEPIGMDDCPPRARAARPVSPRQARLDKAAEAALVNAEARRAALELEREKREQALPGSDVSDEPLTREDAKRGAAFAYRRARSISETDDDPRHLGNLIASLRLATDMMGLSRGGAADDSDKPSDLLDDLEAGHRAEQEIKEAKTA